MYVYVFTPHMSALPGLSSVAMYLIYYTTCHITLLHTTILLDILHYYILDILHYLPYYTTILHYYISSILDILHYYTSSVLDILHYLPY